MKNQQQYTDEALVEMIQGNDERDLDTALKYLFFTQYPDSARLEFSGTVTLTVRSYVLKGGGNEQHVEEVISESAFVFIENIRYGKFDGKSKLTTYLIGICKNKWLEIRHHWFKTKFPDDDQAFEASDTASADLELSSIEFEDEIRKRDSILRQLINQLREGCRKALIAYYMEGFKYEQLQKNLKLGSIHQARKKVSECRSQLKAIIEKDDDLKNFLKNTR